MFDAALRYACGGVRATWLRHAPILRALLAIALLFGIATSAPHAKGLRHIAFYYGEAPPVSLLERFDVAVVEPVAGFQPPVHATQTRWLAYVSVGEVEPSRSYRANIPSQWIVGENKTWHADIIDQAAPGWPDFLVSQVLAPLWQSGYQGFFLDTLDSYHLLKADAAQQARQREGLIRVIRRIRQAYPHAWLILNRGFELLPETHDVVNAVAFESLFQSWDQDSGKYGTVPADERRWLLARVAEIRAWHLPVIAIDYCPAADRRCIRRTAARIRKLGIIPYVGDGHLLAVSRLLLK